MMKSHPAMARILLAGLLVTLIGAAAAQPVYLFKPIRFIVPNPPGASSDLSARLIAQKLTDSWGQ